MTDVKEPGRSSRAPNDIAAPKATSMPRITGCPCGCLTMPPWIDDPDCIRHEPLGPVVQWDGYDVIALGTGCDHQDFRCPAWRRREGAS